MIFKKVLCCCVLPLILGDSLCVNPKMTSEISEKVRNLQISSPKISTEDQKLYKNLAPTLAIMKMFLKDDFKPLPEGLRDNVKAFFSSDRFTPYAGGRQEIILDRELTDILCDLIKREQKEALKGNVTLYHGMTGSNLFVYKYFARLFSHLTGQDLGDVVLRGDHLYAKNPKTGKLFKTLQELKDSYKFRHDYDRGLDVSTLQCNIALSVGPGTSLSTASSVGLFCNSYSVMEYSVSRLIMPALMIQGMSIADARKSAAKAEDLFNKYFSDLGGSLLAISLPIEEADRLAKHIWMGGEEYDPVVTSEVYSNYKQFFNGYGYVGYDLIGMMKFIKSINKDMSDDKIFEEFKNMFSWDVDKNELVERLKYFSSLQSSKRSSVSYLLENLKNSLNKDLSKEDVYFLTNEMYLYLYPKMKAKIFDTFRHPLPKEDIELLDSEIDRLAASHAKSIINSEAKPVDGSFAILRKIATNESASYRIDLLPIFIERGMLSDAEQIIDQHPDFLENVEIARLVLSSTLNALWNNFDEVTEFIEKHCGVNKLLSKIPADELYPFLRMFIEKEGSRLVAVGKLLKSLDNTGLDDRVFADLIFAFFCEYYSEPGLSLNSVLGEKKISQNVMENVLSRMKFMRYIPDGAIELFLEKGFSFNPNEDEGKEHLDELLKICEEKSRGSSNNVIQNILDFYKLNKDDYPQLSEFFNDSGYEYNYEEEMKLRSYLESDEVDKEDKKSRIKELSPLGQFSAVRSLLWSEDKNVQNLGKELQKEIKYPGTSMTISEVEEIYKKYVL